MNAKVVWRAGNSPGEFLSNYRGWILIAQRQSQSGMIWWQWSVRRGGVVKSWFADDCSAAGRAAIQAVDQMEDEQ